MIRIGPAGIPLSCKGRTVKDGIIYTRNLELDAMQVQFVRGIRMEDEEALEIGRVAREAMVDLHVHAPYYTNLAGDEKNRENAYEKIIEAGKLAEAMGAKTLAIHCGLYHEDDPKETHKRVVDSLNHILDAFDEADVKVKLALEVAGKQALFGTLDEILDVCREVPRVVPILDFAHIHARGNGSLLAEEDFVEVFEKCKDLKLDTYLVHFTGILYENGNERHHLPIKKGDLRFEPLVETILDNEYDVTLISHSPILEHDAMYMKIVLDRVREKRELKRQRDEAQRIQDEKKRKEEEEKQKKEEEAAKKKEEAKKKKAKKKPSKKKAGGKKKTSKKKASGKKKGKKKSSKKKSSGKKSSSKKGSSKSKKGGKKKKSSGKKKSSKSKKSSGSKKGSKSKKSSKGKKKSSKSKSKKSSGKKAKKSATKGS